MDLEEKKTEDILNDSKFDITDVSSVHYSSKLRNDETFHSPTRSSSSSSSRFIWDNWEEGGELNGDLDGGDLNSSYMSDITHSPSRSPTSPSHHQLSERSILSTISQVLSIKISN